MRKKKYLLTALALVLGLWIGIQSWSTKHSLPPYIIWSSLFPGSSPFEQTTWFSNAFKKNYNVILHNIAHPNDDNIIHFLFANKVDFAMVGLSGSYFVQEGLFEFARVASGPKPIRLILENRAAHLRTFLVKHDSGINTVAQLRGKRVPWIETAPAINYFTQALLYYAGIKPSEVRYISYPGPEDAIRGLLKGKIDVAFSPSKERVLSEASLPSFPLKYLPMPDNTTAWARVKTVAPFFTATKGELGIGISKDTSVISASYAFPMIITRDDVPAEQVENFTSALLEVLPEIITYDPYMKGWEVTSLQNDWLIPYHDGVVALFKKQGRWTEANQLYNDELIRRQHVLANAWQQQLKNPSKDNDFAWLDHREQSLRAANLTLGFYPFKETYHFYYLNKKDYPAYP